MTNITQQFYLVEKQIVISSLISIKRAILIMTSGGDVVNNDGSGSISIYGKQFDDENFDIKHTAGGFVSMANQGAISFFFTNSKYL